MFCIFCHFHAQSTLQAQTPIIVCVLCVWWQRRRRLRGLRSFRACGPYSLARSLSCLCVCVLSFWHALLVFVHARVPPKFKLSFYYFSALSDTLSQTNWLCVCMCLFELLSRSRCYFCALRESFARLLLFRYFVQRSSPSSSASLCRCLSVCLSRC